MLKRVLLIDDESALRRSLSIGLNQYGYDVEPCETGISALNKLELYEKNSVKLDTIVLDIQLPDINGIKLGKIIREKYPDASMLYVTGYADKLDELEMEKLESDGMLQKPFTAEDLSREINAILEKKEEKKEIEIQEKVDDKAVSAYIFLKVEEKADFFKLYKKLYFMESVLYCDATRGDIDIFLLLQSDSVKDIEEIYNNEIKNLEGIKSSEFLPVGIPVMNDNIKEIINAAGISMFEDGPNAEKLRDSKKSVCSYVIVDIDREKLEDIYPVLRLTENVLYCDYTDGKNSLVLMIHGTQFNEIDKVVENKIINLDGVLKVKEYPIINIFEI